MTNNSDQDVWDRYAQQLSPLKKTQTKKKRATHAKNQLRETGREKMECVRTRSSEKFEKPLKQIDLHHPLERRREKELRKGVVDLDATIDLHGMTQAKAFDALARFMDAQVRFRRRRLLIVTGKGREGSGVLRRNLETWLKQLPHAPHLLAIRPASPRHGGDGAFYVLLRNSEISKT